MKSIIKLESRKSKIILNKIIQKGGLLKIAILISMLYSFTLIWAQNTKSNSARFIVISDWGGRASKGQMAVAEAMGKEAENIEAQFVITGGDNFHEDGIVSETDPRWKKEFENIYSNQSLQIPWYPSAGNHDYRGNIDSEIEYSKYSTRWEFPSLYYAHKEKIDDSTNALIIHIDTSPFIEKYQIEASLYYVDKHDSKKQILWLDSLLTVSKERWVFVVGHHPIYAAVSMHGNTKELIDKILTVLTKHKVTLYICGHYHFLQHLKNDSKDFIVCGGGMEASTTDSRDDVVFGSGSLGFLSIIAKANEVEVRLINDSNKILHTVFIKDEKSN